MAQVSLADKRVHQRVQSARSIWEHVRSRSATTHTHGTGSAGPWKTQPSPPVPAASCHAGNRRARRAVWGPVTVSRRKRRSHGSRRSSAPPGALRTHRVRQQEPTIERINEPRQDPARWHAILARIDKQLTEPFARRLRGPHSVDAPRTHRGLGGFRLRRPARRVGEGFPRTSFRQQTHLHGLRLGQCTLIGEQDQPKAPTCRLNCENRHRVRAAFGMGQAQGV